MVSQKKFYEVDREKKIATIFPPEKIKKLRFLQLQHELPENDVILASVDEMYIKAVELSAVETGLIKSSTLTLSRENFTDDALFNAICRQLDVFGPDGNVESVTQVSLDVSKAFIPA